MWLVGEEPLVDLTALTGRMSNNLEAEETSSLGWINREFLTQNTLLWQLFGLPRTSPLSIHEENCEMVGFGQYFFPFSFFFFCCVLWQKCQMWGSEVANWVEGRHSPFISICEDTMRETNQSSSGYIPVIKGHWMKQHAVHAAGILKQPCSNSLGTQLFFHTMGEKKCLKSLY